MAILTGPNNVEWAGVIFVVSVQQFLFAAKLTVGGFYHLSALYGVLQNLVGSSLFRISRSPELPVSPAYLFTMFGLKILL